MNNRIIHSENEGQKIKARSSDEDFFNLFLLPLLIRVRREDVGRRHNYFLRVQSSQEVLMNIVKYRPYNHINGGEIVCLNSWQTNIWC